MALEVAEEVAADEDVSFISSSSSSSSWKVENKVVSVHLWSLEKQVVNDPLWNNDADAAAAVAVFVLLFLLQLVNGDGVKAKVKAWWYGMRVRLNNDRRTTDVRIFMMIQGIEFNWLVVCDLQDELDFLL